jgi:type IV pilus assembly protein PilF
MLRPLLDVLAAFRGGALAACAAGALLVGCATPVGEGSAGRQAASAGSVLPGTAEETDVRRRARIRLELAASYYQQGNYNVALEELRQSLAIDPEYAPAYGVLGLVYMDLGDRARAEESFQRALRIAPDDSELNNNYGWFLCQTGRERESIARFRNALRNPLYPTPARPMHNAGICSLRMGEETAAEAWFQRSFQADPRNPVALYNLGVIYLKRRDLERARFYTQRLTSSFEPTAQVLWLALRVERLAGDRDAEASFATQLRRRFPGSPEAALLAAGRYGD